MVLQIIIRHISGVRREASKKLLTSVGTGIRINLGLTLWRRIFLNFSTPCMQNVNNTGTKKGSIMKQTAF
jgi:hypothetical protein